MSKLPHRPSKTGRQEIPIDWTEVDKRIAAGCSGMDIATELGMHEDTLYRRCQTENQLTFTEYAAIHRKRGDYLLREAQFVRALSGSDTMLIFLGKVRLEQIEMEKRKELEVQKENQEAFKLVMDQLSEIRSPKIEDKRSISEQ